MPSCRFSLNVSRELMLAYYRGAAREMLVLTDTGQTLAFPAAELRRFVTHEGVVGDFQITFTDDHKLIGITRLTDRKQRQ